MPRIPTRDFGPLDYDASAELQFPHGLPGFENQKRFVLIEKQALAPLVFLQSAETDALCFIAVPVQVVEPGYQLGMTEEDRNLLVDDGDLLSLAIVAASPSAVTVNLLAPVVINLKTRTGLQAVRHDALYSHQHPFPELAACR